MKTFLDEPHTVRVFFCRGVQPDFHFWEKVMDALVPVTSATDYKSSLAPGIYDNEIRDWVPFGNLEFTRNDLNKWANMDNSRYQFDRLSVSFPSVKKCYEEKVTPDIFIKSSVKPSASETRYDFIFMIALKKQFIQSVSNRNVDTNASLSKLEEIIHPVFKVKTERTWAIAVKDYQYTDALHDFFPSTLLKNEKSFILNEVHVGWSIESH